MDLAELRKQVKQSWIMLLSFFLPPCLLFLILYLMPMNTGLHTGIAIGLAIQTAVIIFKVIGLVKLEAYVRQRTSR
jgi:hypothetical protein